jgi:hypothetical protein
VALEDIGVFFGESVECSFEPELNEEEHSGTHLASSDHVEATQDLGVSVNVGQLLGASVLGAVKLVRHTDLGTGR